MLVAVGPDVGPDLSVVVLQVRRVERLFVSLRLPTCDSAADALLERCIQKAEVIVVNDTALSQLDSKFVVSLERVCDEDSFEQHVSVRRCE